jgi:hypothetical protein
MPDYAIIMLTLLPLLIHYAIDATIIIIFAAFTMLSCTLRHFDAIDIDY